MAQTSWPFENIDTTETQFSQWARNINEGIRQGSGSELVVGAPGGAMTVTVGTGQAMIRGHYYSSDAVETLNIAAANPSNPRIDSVVLELNPTANTVILKVLTGTPAGSPVAPSLTQTESGIYQIRLANVAVGTGVLQITSGNITDLRTYMFAGIGKWTTATRPANPVANQTTGYNTTIGAHEFWNGTSWVGFADPITTRGDLIVGGVGGAPTRLPIGANGRILQSNGTDVVWAESGGGGLYYKSTGATVTRTFGTGLFALAYRGGGSMVFGGVSIPQGNTLREFTTEPGTLVLPSQIGLTWTTQSLSFSPGGLGAAFGNGVFVGSNQNADPFTSRSTDMITWTTVSTPGIWLRAFAFGNGIFVGGGNSGVIRTSTDGITWTTRTSPTTAGISSFRFLNNRFVGTTFDGAVIHSTDGVTWTSTSTGLGLLYKATFGNGRFVAGGQTGGGSGALAHSTNLVTWTTVSTTRTQSVYDVAFFNNLYISFHDGTSSSHSTNLVTWTNGGATSGWDHVILGPTNIVATSNDFSVQNSTDGMTWTQNLAFADQNRAIVLGTPGLLVGNTGNRVYYSTPTNVYASIELLTPLTVV